MLSESNIAECQSKFNLSYHVSFAHICQELVGFAGKDVLEVGGSLPPEFVFNYLDVKSWSGIETPEYEESLQEAGGLSHAGTILYDLKDIPKLGFKDRTLEKYNFFLANIEDLPPEYYEKYDLIFSIATFEHIHKLPAALDKMFLALKPGGKLFSLFAPIWSSSNGHHLPKITDRSGQVFEFGNSPIPPWGHLLMRPPELCQLLPVDDEFLDGLILNDINLVIFPDWSQPEENLGFELQEIITKLVNYPEKKSIKVLIYNSQISAEDADLILSSIIMSFLMEQSIEVNEGPEIVLLQKLSPRQWSALIPKLKFRVKLKFENKEAILLSKVKIIPTIELDQIYDHI